MMTLFPTRRPSARMRLTAWCGPHAVVLGSKSVLRTNASYPRSEWTGFNGISQVRRFGEANSSSRER